MSSFIPQELLDSRMKALKKVLEDYEAFRSTEERESKELLVSPSVKDIGCGCPWQRGRGRGEGGREGEGEKEGDALWGPIF